MTDVEFQAALDYLYSFVDYSRTRSDRYAPEAFDLDRVRRLLSELGDPHLGYPKLHVAGTKGKGSVAAMCASALSSAGFRTGLYTSPHMVEFTERIQVDGQPIPSRVLVELVELLKEPASKIEAISTYELITALGFLHFAREEVDFAVIEVGLGGRLDATNVITPEVAVITALSLDHTQFLGESLAEIAGEKAGIIKQGVPIVLAPQQAEAESVISQIAAEREAPLLMVGVDWQYETLSGNLRGQRIRVGDIERGAPVFEISLPLLGDHQVENAAVASAALHLLSERGYEMPVAAIQRGLAEVDWPGRFQILAESPHIIIDAAHNRHSAARLRETLMALFPDRSVRLVFGASADKDVDGMLEELAPIVKHTYLAKAFHPRAADPELLQEKAERAGLTSTVRVRVMDAVAEALRAAKSEDVVLVTGSLFVIGEVLSRWREQDWPFLATGAEGEGQ